MITNEIFNAIVSWYKSYPYKNNIYILWDNNKSAYVYTVIDKEDHNPIDEEWGVRGAVLPLFYEEDFAFYIASKEPQFSIKMISHSALKVLSMWCETEKVTPIFLTTLDRRGNGDKEIDKNKSKFKKEFEHFLFTNIKF